MDVDALDKSTIFFHM